MAKEALKTKKSPSHKGKHKSHEKQLRTEENLQTLTLKVMCAVKKYFDKIDEESIDLVEKRRPVLVNIGFNKCPSNPDIGSRPLRLSCPVNVDSRALLIVRDEKTKDKLEGDADLTSKYQVIIDLSALKNNFSTTQARLNLFKDFDAFYCDRKIIVEAVAFLGYKIRNSWRRPVAVKVPASDLESVKTSLLDQYTYVTNYKIGEAPSCTIRLGSLRGNPADLAQNAVEATLAVRQRIEERDAQCEIESIHLVCDTITVQLIEPETRNIRIEAEDADLDTAASDGSED